ncbi:MAG: PilZ domain-containing protein [Leptospirillia bacterium]
MNEPTAPEPSPEQRRRFERHGFRLPVTVTLSGGDVVDTQTDTLALGGCHLPWDHDPLPSGAELTVCLYLDSNRSEAPVKTPGRVAYYVGGGMGIEFHNMDRDAYGRLRAFFLFRDLHSFTTDCHRPTDN